MELLILILEIRYKSLDTPDSSDKHVELFRFITGENPRNPPKQKLGLEVDHKTSNTRVVIEDDRIALSVEYSAVLQSKRRLFEILSFIYHKFPYAYREIQRLGVKTSWISTWNNSFTSLVYRFKEVFFKKVLLTNEAEDVGIPLIFREGGFQVNYSTGPMKPEQVKNYITFKDRNLPHDSIFVDVDRFDQNNQVNNSLRDIKTFISSSITYGEEKASQTVSLLEKNNG